MVQGKAQLKGVIKLQPGSQVQLHGLQNSKELNGQVGSLLQFDAVKLRWGVELPGGKKVSLKMSNLLPLATEVEPAVEVPMLGPTPVEQAADADGYVKADAPLACEAVATSEKIAEVAGETTATAIEVEESPAEQACAGSADVVEPEALATSEQLAATDKEPGALNDEEWPVLPTSAETQAKIQSGCWWDGGSAAKRFTEQLISNDSSLLSVCLVPPKRFNDDDAKEVCEALEKNSVCQELVASGHVLSKDSCERIAQMLRVNKTLQSLSIGESSLGELAVILFEGLAQNTSITSLDLEKKGLPVEAFRTLATSLQSRQNLQAAPLGCLRLSRNVAIGKALSESILFQAPKKLELCECALRPEHGDILGQWVSRGVEDLDLRDNSSFGGDGVEKLMRAVLAAKGSQPLILQRLKLDGCAIGDDGLEMIADAFTRGLELEHLFIERCEVTLAGCEFLVNGLRNRRLQTLSARANVIGDAGCALLAQCAERLDLSSTNLTGEVLSTLGEQSLVSLELFSNPALGPSVGSWCAKLDSSQWQRLEYLDLSGCALQDEGFLCVINTLMERPSLMPSLRNLLIGANDVKEDDDKYDLIDRLGETRGGRLETKWQNSK